LVKQNLENKQDLQQKYLHDQHITTFVYSRTVVFKRVPFDLIWEEFLIPGRKFVPRINWGGKGVDKTPEVFMIWLTEKATQRDWLRWACLQYARTSCRD